MSPKRRKGRKPRSSSDGWYTLSQVAVVSGLSRTTVRRYLDQGRFTGARRDDSQGSGNRAQWLVHTGELVRLGMVKSEVGPVPAPSVDETSTQLKIRLAVAEARAEERAATISMLVAERGNFIEVLSRVVDMLQSSDRPAVARPTVDL